MGLRKFGTSRRQRHRGGSLAAAAALDAALAQFPALTPVVGKLGLTYNALLAPAGAPTVTLSADDLTAYAGRYADPDEVLTFTRSGDGLERAQVWTGPYTGI